MTRPAEVASYMLLVQLAGARLPRLNSSTVYRFLTTSFLGMDDRMKNVGNRAYLTASLNATTASVDLTPLEPYAMSLKHA